VRGEEVGWGASSVVVVGSVVVGSVRVVVGSWTFRFDGCGGWLGW
jgi:hypothetical protein